MICISAQWILNIHIIWLRTVWFNFIHEVNWNFWIILQITLFLFSNIFSDRIWWDAEFCHTRWWSQLKEIFFALCKHFLSSVYITWLIHDRLLSFYLNVVALLSHLYHVIAVSLSWTFLSSNCIILSLHVFIILKV